MKLLIFFAFTALLNLQVSYAGSWPQWTIKFYGDGWDVQEVNDSELIKMAENQKHQVGIFISGKKFPGGIEQLLNAFRSAPGVPDQEKYELIEIKGVKAIQLLSSMTQNGKKVGVWGLMFVRNDSVIALQGIFQNEEGKSFLKKTLESFEFID